MGITHVVIHAHECTMFFQVFPQKSNVHHPKVLSGTPLPPLHLLNILECWLECCYLLNWMIVICILVWVEFVVYFLVWQVLGWMRHVPCWKHGGFLVSFLMEWVSEQCLSHFHSLPQLVTVAGQRLHSVWLQKVQTVFHQIADGVYDLMVSRKMWSKTCSVALPRVIVSRSAVQNWSEAMVGFHMEYYLAISQ